MAAQMMRLESNDNQIFEVDEEVAKQNGMLDNLSESIDYIFCMILELNIFELFMLHNIVLLLYDGILWARNVRMVKAQGLIPGYGNKYMH